MLQCPISEDFSTFYIYQCPSSEHTFIPTMLPHRDPMPSRKENARLDNLAKVINQYSFIQDTPSQQEAYRQRGQSRAAEVMVRERMERENMNFNSAIHTAYRETGCKPGSDGWKTGGKR